MGVVEPGVEAGEAHMQECPGEEDGVDGREFEALGECHGGFLEFFVGEEGQYGGEVEGCGVEGFIGASGDEGVGRGDESAGADEEGEEESEGAGEFEGFPHVEDGDVFGAAQHVVEDADGSDEEVAGGEDGPGDEGDGAGGSTHVELDAEVDEA